jgi:hypothetical protein
MHVPVIFRLSKSKSPSSPLELLYIPEQVTTLFFFFFPFFDGSLELDTPNCMDFFAGAMSLKRLALASRARISSFVISIFDPFLRMSVCASPFNAFACTFTCALASAFEDFLPSPTRFKIAGVNDDDDDDVFSDVIVVDGIAVAAILILLGLDAFDDDDVVAPSSKTLFFVFVEASLAALCSWL